MLKSTMMKPAILAGLLALCSTAAAAATSEAAWKADLAETNKAYAVLPHAMLKIQDAAYLGEGQTATLVGTKGLPGSYKWVLGRSSERGADGVLRRRQSRDRNERRSAFQSAGRCRGRQGCRRSGLSDSGSGRRARHSRLRLQPAKSRRRRHSRASITFLTIRATSSRRASRPTPRLRRTCS